MSRAVFLRALAGLSAIDAEQPAGPPPLAAAELPPRSGWPAAGWMQPMPRVKMPRFARLDRLAQLALVAASRAVEAAGQPQLREASPPAGVALGSRYGAHLTNELFWRGVRGPAGASPALFAYTLPSAAAAEISMYFGLTGPPLTFAGAADSGLEAVAAAATSVASGTCSRMVAGAADVLGPALLLARPAERLAEGAACLLLDGEPEQARARLAGVGRTAGAGAEARAVQAALEEAGLEPAALALLLVPESSDGEEVRAEPFAAARPALRRYSERVGMAAAPLLASLGPLQAGELPCLVTAGDSRGATALCWTAVR